MDDSFFDVKPAGQATDDRSIPEFHTHAVFVGKKADPPYEDRDYVRIIVPGQRDVVDREVKVEDQERWPRQWEAYRSGKDAPLNGYPLDKSGLFGPAEVLMLKSYQFRTVEDVASMPDTAVQRIGRGAMEWKKQCGRWIMEHQSHDSLIDRIDKLERGEGIGPNPAIPAPRADDSEELTVKKIELKEERKKNAKLREKNARLKADNDALQAKVNAMSGYPTGAATETTEVA